MIGLALLLIIHMCVSVIYTDIIYKFISINCKRTKINPTKSVEAIIQHILAEKQLSDTVTIDAQSLADTSRGFYLEKNKTIQIPSLDTTALAVGVAIHECGHAIHYNKSETMLKIIKTRNVLKKFSLLDMASPVAVPFFAAFCPPLYIFFSIFLIKLIIRVIFEFIVEADANLRVFKYVKQFVPHVSERSSVIKFMLASMLTYLSTIG